MLCNGNDYLLNHYITHHKNHIMKKQSRGFTLIELLVVIAIIGILSSVVLASLSTARNKGADAAAMSQINSVRAQAAIYFDTNNQSYGYATPTGKIGCPIVTAAPAGLFTDPTMVALLAGANTQSGGSATSPSNAVVCAADATSFAVATVLKGSGYTYCVDSAGTAKKNTAATATVAAPNSVAAAAAISGTTCS